MVVPVYRSIRFQWERTWHSLCWIGPVLSREAHCPQGHLIACSLSSPTLCCRQIAMQIFRLLPRKLSCHNHGVKIFSIPEYLARDDSSLLEPCSFVSSLSRLVDCQELYVNRLQS